MSATVMLEIRAAEGGADAKDLVREQFGVYTRYLVRNGCKLDLIDERAGFVAAEVSGKGAARLLAMEPGGHRWQRIPPTERRGRRHTSTVTVAVMPVTDAEVAALRDSDIEWSATRGSGAGGQARNKTSNAVQAKHLPTGTTVRVESERSQLQNLTTAKRLLAARIADTERTTRTSAEAAERRRQVGSGQRGDKVRTVRLQDGQVTDHRLGTRMAADRYLAGHLEDLVAGASA